jgi:hypothetical protein
MKYPIGIQSFDRLREDGFVYVDKTALVYYLLDFPNNEVRKGFHCMTKVEL